MKDLQTVLEALEEAKTSDDGEGKWNRNSKAIAIVKQMMQAEPVGYVFAGRGLDYIGCVISGTPNNDYVPVYASPVVPQAVPAEPSCPDCKAPDLLYECIHCSASNYPAVPKVTAGFVLVPMEATQEMISAGRTTPMLSDSEFDEDEDYRAVYKAMCAAAPKVTE